MSERFGAALGFLFVSALAAASPALAEEAERLFRVDSKVEKPGASPNVLEVTYTMVNTSSKRITAWDFGCVDVVQAELGGLSRAAVDGYRVLEMYLEGREGVRLESDGIVEPNQRVERTFLVNPTHKSGPYVPKTCSPVVAIFEDATFEGAEDLAESHFERRAQEAVEARRARRALEEQLGQGLSLAAAIDAVIEALPRRPLGRVSQSIHRGYPVTPEMVLEELENDYRWAFEHLPEKWQQRVAEELE